ncbi:MAG: phosphate ABC transporter permease subunit PstC [Actinomycetota bacterium]
MSVGGAMDAATILRGDPRRQRRERRVRGAFLAAACVALVVSAAIVVSLVGRAGHFALNIDLSALWSRGWFPRRGLYDLRTIFVGSFLVAGVAMLVAAPFGLGAAVYLSEYATPRMRRIAKPVLEVLAGIPSVVMGFFALTVISPTVVQRLVADATLFNLAAAGLAVGLLVVPLVASIAEDALHAVPRGMREASYGLGARRRTTSLRVVAPAAVSGIVAALIVGVSRAIGETMVVAIAAGGTGGSLFSLDLFRPGQTATAAMTALATGSDQVKGEALTFESLFFVGFLLFVLTLGLNVLSERTVRRLRKRF